jgi:histone H3/H4
METGMTNLQFKAFARLIRKLLVEKKLDEVVEVLDKIIEES